MTPQFSFSLHGLRAGLGLTVEVAEACVEVVSETCGSECIRRVRIQCPGVVEADITIKVGMLLATSRV